MSTLTEAQRTWLKDLGVDLAALTDVDAASGPPAASRAAAGVPSPFAADAPRAASAGGVDPLAAPGAGKPFDPRAPLDPALLRKIVEEGAQRDLAEAEARLARIDTALKEAAAFLQSMDKQEMQDAGYAGVVALVRERFPDLADLKTLLRNLDVKAPAAKGKRPSANALIEMVEKVARDRGVHVNWLVKDPAGAAVEMMRAGYLAQLPAGLSLKIDAGVVKLTATGAAVNVKAGGGEVEGKAEKGGAELAFKQRDLTIQVQNDGWKEFDPTLRAQWQRVEGEARTVLQLEADRDQAKLALEQKGKDSETKATLTADFEKKQAAFELAWKKLREQIDAAATASEEKITASVTYLKKDANDKDAVKAGVEAEVQLKALQGRLKAYYATPSVKAALEVTAAADKVTAKLELTAVKSGVVVTAAFEKALAETKASVAVLLRDGKTQLAAEVKQKADELSAKLSVVHEQKDLKLAMELEKTLKDVRGKIELAYKKGATTAKVGAEASTSGEAGGQVAIEIALGQGRSFSTDTGKLALTANVSNKGYKFEIAFSLGEPVEPDSVRSLANDVDQQIREIYALLADQEVRNLQDMEKVNQKLQEKIAPLKGKLEKAKTLKGKSAIQASFGFSIQGDWPAGGRAVPPAAMFGATLTF